nr:uncharacterized protein LOC129453004 [Misgurnus anguillicaudatus]
MMTMFVFALFVCGVFGSEFVSVMEGDSVTLSVSLTETQRKEGISWKFGPQKITIAEIEVGDNNICLYDDRADGSFKGRLKLDHSGSLTITNIRITDSGLYQLINTNTNNQLNIFNLGVFGSEFVSVMEGDSVTLSVSLNETQIKEGIAWKFGHQEMTVPETTIAELEDKGNNVRFYKDRAEGRFRDRLKLKKHTGSLTITNTNITHTGLYKVINTKTNTKLKTFNITVHGVFGRKFLSVMEGDSVTLSVSLTETQRKEGIYWKFGPREITIAEIEVGDNNMRLYEDRVDGRFKGRLKLDHSGSLTITNIRTTDSGLYKVTQTSTDNQLNVFNLTVEK